MSVAELEERPPYVRFETRAVEDREKTQETGIYSFKDVVFALITPSGSKDVHEEKAESWLKKQAQNARNGRIPEAHLNYYQERFEAYKKGQELPEDGHPIKGWSLISPAQQEQIVQANIRTVEDLAQAHEDALQRIGMGARALKQKAEAWLQSGNTGQAASEIHDLRKQLETSEREREKQAATIQQLVARVEAMESGREMDHSPTSDAETDDAPRNKDGSPRKKPGPKPNKARI